MKSKKVMLAVAVALLLVAAATAGAALEWAWLAVLGLGLLLTMVLVVVMDTNRRVRYLRKGFRQTLQSVKVEAVPSRGGATKVAGPSAAAAPVAAAPGATSEDLAGAVRLIQAQYIGRLDRAQAALEQAAADLRAARDER